MSDTFTPPIPARPSTCVKCVFWKATRGTWTGQAVGEGLCYLEPVRVARRPDDPACRHGEAR